MSSWHDTWLNTIASLLYLKKVCPDTYFHNVDLIGLVAVEVKEKSLMFKNT